MLESSPLSTPNAECDKRQQFRMQAIDEIITSERAYLSQLEMLMEYFVQPLKEQAIIDDTSHTLLFGQIEMIHNLNGEFLYELEKNKQHVARAFLTMSPFFKLYSVYAFDYRSALLSVQQLQQRNPVFRQFLLRNESRPEVQRKLNSLMIVPIQRVPRYKLLLEQVLLYTSPADADFKLLKESIKQVESIVSHIDACVEEQEITQQLLNLQNSLLQRNPNIVKPSRKVLLEGVLQKVTRRGAAIRRYCVLMSDIFMYCKVLKERPSAAHVENALACCCIMPLKKCKVYELFPSHFKLTCQGDGLLLGSEDPQLIRKWVVSLREAIEAHIQCRQTLRKESSKRKPLRKRELKHFDMDYMLPAKRLKYDYDIVFRNRQQSSDSEDDVLNESTSNFSCFSRRRAVVREQLPTPKAYELPRAQSILKRNEMHDALFPLRAQGEGKENVPLPLPRKRVKFDESKCHASAAKTQPYVFNVAKKPAAALSERIYSFFANLF